MNPLARQTLVARWVERQTKAMAWDRDLVLQRQDLHRETEEELDTLRQEDPDEYWNVLLEALHTNQSDDVLMALSSRLLMLLEENPDRFIGRLEAQAQSDSQFKELLGWLIPSEPNSEYWLRVKKVAGDVPW